MTARRRLTMRLTPLLDLLLIVIFAQFMDVQEREATTLDEAHRVIEQRNRARFKLSNLQATHERALATLAGAERSISRLQAENERLAAEREQLRSDTERALAQQRLLGELVAELFDVPDSVISRVLTPEGAAAPAASADQREFLEARFRELSLQQAGQLIRHLLSFEEMKKRTDLWDLHIDETGWFTLHAGDEKRGFRANSPDDFANRFYAIYRSLPEPKSLVVILLSYGDARADVREAAIEGLPRVTDRMRREAGGAIRFEYAILGFQPSPDE